MSSETSCGFAFWDAIKLSTRTFISIYQCIGRPRRVTSVRNESGVDEVGRVHVVREEADGVVQDGVEERLKLVCCRWDVGCTICEGRDGHVPPCSL